jgi:membrane fusion protein (multidrug efflux system)
LIGRLNVAVGNYPGTGAARPLATVTQLDPIYVVFNVSENLYLRAAGDSADRAGLNHIELILSDNSRYPHLGRFANLGDAVNAKSGSVPVVASFPNPGGRLLPGMFGRVRLTAGERPNAVLVPERAVFDAQGSRAVYVVKPDATVALRSVVSESSYQDKSIISSGLNGGETVIVEGILKVRPGSKVSPRPAKEAN